MLATVWSRAAAVSTPGRSRMGRLAQVDDQALADDRVQQPLGDPGEARGAHHVPDQQPVVTGDERVLVLLDPHGALQPPVRRVQGVRVMTGDRLEAGLLEALAQLVAL